jgi:hypothetical protein
MTGGSREVAGAASHHGRSADRRPARVTCAAVLAGLYAGLLVFVSALTCYQLLSGAVGTLGGVPHDRFELRGVLAIILFTAAGAGCLLFGAGQAAAGRDYRWILWPLRVFLLIGVVGQSLDVIGGGLTPGHLVGFAILAAAALPVALLSTTRAKAYLKPKTEQQPSEVSL